MAKAIIKKWVFAFSFLTLFVTLPAGAASVDYADLYDKISPSVVTVDTRSLEFGAAGIRVKPGIGTGFLITPSLVITAKHVVADVDKIQVRLSDESRVSATLIATHDATDVALLKLASAVNNPVMAELGDSNTAKIGASVFIVGTPFGIEQTLSVGYLSGRRKKGELEDGSAIEFLQTDTAINPGNSGGPMFNAKGEVIGVVSFIMTNGGGSDGIGFASAINSAYDAVMNSSGYLAGFEGTKLTTKQARALNVPAEGVLIQRIVEGSIADKFGLRAGSIPATIAGKELILGGDIILDLQCSDCRKESYKDINSVVSHLAGTRPLTIKIFREGEVVRLHSKPARVQTAYSYTHP